MIKKESPQEKEVKIPTAKALQMNFSELQKAAQNNFQEVPGPVSIMPDERKRSKRKIPIRDNLGLGGQDVQKETGTDEKGTQNVPRKSLERYVADKLEDTGLHPLWSLYDVTILRILIPGEIVETAINGNTHRTRIPGIVTDVFDNDTATEILYEFLKTDGDPDIIIRKKLSEIGADLGSLRYCKLKPLPPYGRKKWEEKLSNY